MTELIIDNVCDISNVTYQHRVDDPELYNFCPVPGGGEDAFLFGALACIIACFLHFSSLSAVLVLVAGVIAEVFVFCYNFGRLGNSFVLWLGVNPPDLLLYGFLPPLLLDAALGLDWFVFKKVAKHSVTYAFLVVLGTTAIVTPVMLFALNSDQWTWQHGALFVSTLASTDALAVSAIIKGVSGPEHLTSLMEGESLLNDATSLVLFTVFLEATKQVNQGVQESWIQLLPSMSKDIARLALGGSLVGLVTGWITLKCLRVMRITGATVSKELAFIQGMSFLTFYVAQGPLNVSGVIAVVIYGMFGSSTDKFELSNTEKEKQLDAVQGTLGGALNGIVFFLGGVTATNFLLRATPALHDSLQMTLLFVPFIFIAMFVVRALCVAIINGVFWLLKSSPLSWHEVPFVTWGGLRGALSLIMAMVIAAEHAHKSGDENDDSLIIAQMVTWTSSFVLITLVVNAPTLPHLLQQSGLLDTPIAKQEVMRKVKKGLLTKTKEIIESLKADDEELLRWVDWSIVETVSTENTESKSRRHWYSIYRKSMPKHETGGAISEAMGGKEEKASFADVEQPLLPHGSMPTEVSPSQDVSSTHKFTLDTEHEIPFLASSIDGRKDASALPLSAAAGVESRGGHDAEDSRASPSGASSPIVLIKPDESDLNAWWSEVEKKHRDEPESSWSAERDSSLTVMEERTRLIWGIKRYIFHRRSDGLLSPEGARILGDACDLSIERCDEPLNIWPIVNKEVAERITIQSFAWIFHTARRAAYSCPPLLQKIIVPVTKWSTSWIGNYLSKAMLESCEVAIAYFMALSDCKQAKRLEESSPNSLLTLELHVERDRVRNFVADREIEAPAHFKAMQTYRAIMAVIFRQLKFIESIYEAGYINIDESQKMSEPIENKRQVLEVLGPVGSGWQKSDDILHSLSFLSCLCEADLNEILTAGTIKEFGANEIVWSDSNALDTFALAVVVRGLVRYTSENEATKPGNKLLGSGSLLGVVPALTNSRTHLPGGKQVLAQASRLQKGVLVFFLPTRVLYNANARAYDGERPYQAMMLDLHRQAGLQILEVLKSTVRKQVAKEWMHREHQRLEEDLQHEAETGHDDGETIFSDQSFTGHIDAREAKIEKKSQAYGIKVEASIKKGLGRATIINLEPYQTYNQRSHFILLAGSLQRHSSGTGKQLAKAVSMGAKIVAPHVFPYLPTLHVANTKATVAYLTGHEGGILIACPPPNNREIVEAEDLYPDNSLSGLDLSQASATDVD